MIQFKDSICEKCYFPISEKGIAREKRPEVRRDLTSYVQSEIVERLEFVGELIRLRTAERRLELQGYSRIDKRVRPRSNDHEGLIIIYKRNVNTEADEFRAFKHSLYNADAFVSLRWRTIDGERYVATEYVRGSISGNPLHNLIHVQYQTLCVELAKRTSVTRRAWGRNLTRDESIRLGNNVCAHILGPQPWPYAQVIPRYKAEWDDDIQKNRLIIACTFVSWDRCDEDEWVAAGGDPRLSGPQ